MRSARLRGINAVRIGRIRGPEATNANFCRKREKWNFGFPVCERCHLKRKSLCFAELGGKARNVSVLVAVGVNDGGYREILGVAEGSREDKESWSNFLRYLKERGFKGVRLIVSDKCPGLYEVIGDFFPEAKWQRRIAHGYRNAFTMCSWKHLREVVAMLKAIHNQEDKEAARQKAALVAEKLRTLKLERIAGFVETSLEATLSG